MIEKIKRSMKILDFPQYVDADGLHGYCPCCRMWRRTTFYLDSPLHFWRCEYCHNDDYLGYMRNVQLELAL